MPGADVLSGVATRGGNANSRASGELCSVICLRPMAIDQTERRISLEEIAADLGVSTSTVSRVLNNKPGISERVRKATQKLLDQYGYSKREASSAKRQRLKSVAFAVTEVLLEQINAGNAFYGRHLISIQNAVTKAGLYPLLVGTKGDLDSSGLLRCVEEMRVQAVVGEGWSEELIKRHAAEVPVVLLNMEDPTSRVDAITTNVEYAARLELQHLFDMGHRNIACFRLNVPRCSWEDRRFWKEYYAFCQLHELALGAEYFQPIDFEKNRHAEAVSRFLSSVLKAKKPATAVVTHDAYAPHFIEELARRGLDVPGDFSVVGYNDVQEFWVDSPVAITSYRQDFESMANEAVRLLFSRHKSPEIPARLVQMTGELVSRGSSGPAPKR